MGWGRSPSCQGRISQRTLGMGGGEQTTDRHDTENRDTEFYIKVVRFGDCQERGGAGERRGHPDREEGENKKPPGDTQAHCCRG